ncbi:MAG: malate dehydrogenase [Patescibacteria group bacterium]|nr:MAG: malate dehydrogenase [Patescibacteria group bacterium]
MKETIRVAITGAGGQIASALLPHLLSGEVFGKERRIALHLLEMPRGMKRLEGTVMELEDSAFPLLESTVIGDDPRAIFNGVHWVIFLAGKPRTKGMQRSDLLKVNGDIAKEHGKALVKAAQDVRILVVANPANTNCLIASTAAGEIPVERFAAMTSLDETRARAQLAKKAGLSAEEAHRVTNVAIWGNHSPTMHPDASHARIDGELVSGMIDTGWLRGEFVELVQERGKRVIDTSGHSSALSAAKAIADHIKHIITPTPDGEWFSAGILSDGSYGIPKDVVFSFPLVSDSKGNCRIVQGIVQDAFTKERLRATLDELLEEKKEAEALGLLSD